MAHVGWYLVDVDRARAAWASLLVMLQSEAAGEGVKARMRGPDVAGLQLAHLAIGETCFCLSTGAQLPYQTGPDGVDYPVLASKEHVRAATKLDRTHPGRYLLSALEQCYQLTETLEPAPAEPGAGPELLAQPYRPGPVGASPALPGAVGPTTQAEFASLGYIGHIVLGVVGVSAVVAGAYVADRYLDGKNDADVSLGRVKAEADAQAKVEIAKAKLEAGQPVGLDEVDAANADAYQRRQLIKDVAPWAIGLPIAAGVALIGARKARLL